MLGAESCTQVMTFLSTGDCIFVMFGQSFKMRMEENNMKINSIFGAISTLQLIAIVAFYASLKADVLFNKKDVDVLSTINEFVYDEKFEFNYEKHGFNFAVAFTAYDNEQEWILDPTYGELVFNTYYWGEQSDGVYRAGRDPMKTMHRCTREELGLTDDKDASQFNEYEETGLGFISFYWKKFLCIDAEETRVSGDFNS